MASRRESDSERLGKRLREQNNALAKRNSAPKKSRNGISSQPLKSFWKPVMTASPNPFSSSVTSLSHKGLHHQSQEQALSYLPMSLG